MIDRFDIQKLQHLPIEQVAEALGLTVHHHKALCPFHNDSNPSLTFHRGRNRYRCFVCDAHGGTIDLVMRYLNKPFIEACKWLADGSSIILEMPHHLIPHSMRKRHEGGPHSGLHPALIPCLTRDLTESPQPRFKFPQGAKCSIYNLPVLNLLKPGETLFIAEGASDCWSLLSSGHKSIAIPSATLLSKKDKEQLSIINSQLSIRFAMFPDRDEPGERLFLQLQKVLPSLVRHDLPSGCKDFSDYYLKTLIPHSMRNLPQPSSLNPQPSPMLNVK